MQHLWAFQETSISIKHQTDLTLTVDYLFICKHPFDFLYCQKSTMHDPQLETSCGVCTRFLASFSSSIKGDFKFFWSSSFSRPCKTQQLKYIHVSLRVRMKIGKKVMVVLQLSLKLSPENRNTALTSFAPVHIMLHMFTHAGYPFFTLCLRANLTPFSTTSKKLPSNVIMFQIFSFWVRSRSLRHTNWTFYQYYQL